MMMHIYKENQKREWSGINGDGDDVRWDEVRGGWGREEDMTEWSEGTSSHRDDAWMNGDVSEKSQVPCFLFCQPIKTKRCICTVSIYELGNDFANGFKFFVDDWKGIDDLTMSGIFLSTLCLKRSSHRWRESPRSEILLFWTKHFYLFIYVGYSRRCGHTLSRTPMLTCVVNECLHYSRLIWFQSLFSIQNWHHRLNKHRNH